MLFRSVSQSRYVCNQKAWDDANLGLRLTAPDLDDPYAVCTTTPKAKKWVKALAMDPTTYVPQYVDEHTGKLRLPTTFDNKYLPQKRVQWLSNKYSGTRLGKQELEGLFLDDVAGALWNRDIIKYISDSEKIPRFVKTFVAVDPAGSKSRAVADKNSLSEDQRQNQQKNADTAIAVVSLAADGNFYVQELKSGQWSPSEWALETIKLFFMYKPIS